MESIPDNTKISEQLFPLFVPPTGPAMMLVTHYYITGRSQASKDDFTQDPLEQAQWCRDHLPYFASLAKRIIIMRNTLAHQGVITPMMLTKTREALIAFGKKETKAACVLELLTTRFENVIAQEGSHGSMICFYCGSVLSRPIEPIRTVVEPLDPFPTGAVSLNWLKSNGFKERLKGCRIKILCGKWYGKCGIFRSWSGTTTMIDVEGFGPLRFSIGVLVHILPTF